MSQLPHKSSIFFLSQSIHMCFFILFEGRFHHFFCNLSIEDLLENDVHLRVIKHFIEKILSSLNIRSMSSDVGPVTS